ncbi:vesicle transport through interaction with t-SNAREs homolog 1B isoform X3 [Schistocerca cancellata]|uniref:vesicle transport through interaction with t-SNAREs homolog 1B isoform X3 n=1 Tax=Schistocerca cancellata TaxID=274614 RepID=UPI0021198D0B|nr:vesicle transport through interaction with t-SNAREs homolog 1B isoform X3 [Schistocerca cancellata]
MVSWAGNIQDDPVRRTVLEGHAALERTANSLARSQAIAAETETLGGEVIAELGEQRESLLRKVKMKINEAPGEVGEKVRAKMQTVLQKNTGLKELCAAADILSGKSSTPDCSIPVQHVPKMRHYLQTNPWYSN